MSHHPLHAHASTSALPGGSPPGGSPPGGSPPGPDPQRVPAEHAEHTQDTLRTPSGCAPPLATGPRFADTAGLTRERAAQPTTGAVRLAGVPHGQEDDPAEPGAAAPTEGADESLFLPRPGRHQTLRSWPLLILALPAAVAVWSGWVRIGQMTGFGQVHPLPGIWDSPAPGHRHHLARRRRSLRRLRAARVAVPQRRLVRPDPPVRPRLRPRIAPARHGRPDRLPPPRTSRDHPCTLGHLATGRLPAAA
jgi:hypothetical protein